MSFYDGEKLWSYKKVLDKLINLYHTCFISGMNIEDDIRLVHDILQYTWKVRWIFTVHPMEVTYRPFTFYTWYKYQMFFFCTYIVNGVTSIANARSCCYLCCHWIYRNPHTCKSWGDWTVVHHSPIACGSFVVFALIVPSLSTINYDFNRVLSPFQQQNDNSTLYAVEVAVAWGLYNDSLMDEYQTYTLTCTLGDFNTSTSDVKEIDNA